MRTRATRPAIPLPRETAPPMSAAEYYTQLVALDAARAALTVSYTTSQTYPRHAYHATEPTQVVHSDAEALALGEGWSATPLAAPPVLDALEPATAVLGSPDFTLHVRGSGFAADAVILWNGSPEPTTVVSPTELTTGVNMATAVAAVTIPVTVTQGGVVSNALDFTFTAPAATANRRVPA